MVHFCSQITLIRNFGAPFSWRPPATPGQPGLRYATASKDRAPASELVLLRGGLPSKIALQGESSSPNCVSRGRCRLRKSENIFSSARPRQPLNRELLCFDIQTCMTKREQLCLTRAIEIKGSGRKCPLHIISDNNLSTLVTSCLLSKFQK